MVSTLKFHDPYPPLKQDPKIFLRKIPFIIPKKYLELLQEHDGGFLDYDFQYYSNSFEEIIESGIGVLFGLNHKYNLIKEYNNPPEFFPKGLVSFGENGGGNFVCFDYRNNPKTDNPPIVYWDHEADIGKDVSFIAKNFDEFISMLKEPD